jgi:hypothetical protein
MAYPTLGKAAVAIAPSRMVPLLPTQFIGNKEKKYYLPFSKADSRQKIPGLPGFFCVLIIFLSFWV